jgi:hypothetical protein
MRTSVGILTAFLALLSQGIPAQAQRADSVATQRTAPLTRVPIVSEAPYWDGYVVPRYRYRAEDDRVDPCGGPVVPVIRIGPQEKTAPTWLANSLGLGRIQGRDWPCRDRRR